MYRIIRDLFGKVTFEQRPEEVREIIGKSISKIDQRTQLRTGKASETLREFFQINMPLLPELLVHFCRVDMQVSWGRSRQRVQLLVLLSSYSDCDNIFPV